MRIWGAVVLLTLAGTGLAPGQGRPRSDEKGTYLGILFGPVPPTVRAQLPSLSDGAVIVTHVLPGSPAARAKLALHDLVVEYDGHKVKDTLHLARLIREGKPGQAVNVKLLRAGKEVTARPTLALGLPLSVADDTPAPTEPPGMGKNGAPPPVTISAIPMDGNRIRLTIEYYKEGRSRTDACEGTPEQIDLQIRQLPPKLQEFARVAVKRVRELGFQQPSPR